MLLLNYRIKTWAKITQDNTSRARWTEKNKDKKKNRCIANAEKNNLSRHFFVRAIFLSGQKGIYHQSGHNINLKITFSVF